MYLLTVTWWNLTEVVEWQSNKNIQLKIRVSFVCNGEIQNDFEMTTETIDICQLMRMVTSLEFHS